MKLKGLGIIVCSTFGFAAADNLRRRLEEDELPSDFPSMVPSDMPSQVPSGTPTDKPSVVPTTSPIEPITAEFDWLPFGILEPETRSFGFGEEIEMSRDGLTVAVLDGDNAVEVYSRSSKGDGQWNLMGEKISYGGIINFQLSPDALHLLIHTTRNIAVMFWNGTSWVRQGPNLPKIVTVDSSAAMSGDGKTVAIGYPGQFHDFYRTRGFVDVFKLDGDSWKKEFRIDARGDTERNVGRSVTLSEDGSILAYAGRGTNAYSKMFVEVYDVNTQLALGRRFVTAQPFSHATPLLSDDGKTMFVRDPVKGMKLYQFEQQFWLDRSRGLPDNYLVISVDISSDGSKLILCNANERRAEVYELQTPYRRPSFWEKTVDFHENFGVALPGRDCTMSGDGSVVGTSGWTATDFTAGAIAIWQSN